jgi:hypothetical protein
MMFGRNYNGHRASLGYSVRSVEEADRAFYGRAQWSMKFAILPHRCDVTKKIIWLEYAYRGVAIWTGPGDDAVETRWHSKFEHIIFQLKRA